MYSLKKHHLILTLKCELNLHIQTKIHVSLAVDFSVNIDDNSHESEAQEIGQLDNRTFTNIEW